MSSDAANVVDPGVREAELAQRALQLLGLSLNRILPVTTPVDGGSGWLSVDRVARAGFNRARRVQSRAPQADD
jgi:hypothetical protein